MITARAYKPPTSATLHPPQWHSPKSYDGPGDVIATGTPSGVGFFRDPKLFMKPGDRVEVEISGIGTLANPII